MAEKQENTLTVLKQKLDSASLNESFQKMLGKKAAGFMTSIMTVVQNSDLLQKAPANSIILAAGQAAALDLPISPSLGLAAIVPFKDNKNNTVSATLQIMRNGWVELALRTGLFEYIVCEPVYDGELVSRNRFTEEFVFDETKRVSNKMVGYMASFKLTTGYHKTVYWTIDDLKKHGLHYSQTFKKGYGLWVTDFEAMCAKTVIKNLITKYAPKSIESLNMAIESDQGSFFGDDLTSVGHTTPKYLDRAEDARGDSKAFVEAQVVESTPTGAAPQQPQAPAPAPQPEPKRTYTRKAAAQPANDGQPVPPAPAMPSYGAPAPAAPQQPVTPQQPQYQAPAPQPQMPPQKPAPAPQQPVAPQAPAQPQYQQPTPQPQPQYQAPAPAPSDKLDDDDF
jgi:recombination protein RecT